MLTLQHSTAVQPGRKIQPAYMWRCVAFFVLHLCLLWPAKSSSAPKAWWYDDFPLADGT